MVRHREFDTEEVLDKAIELFGKKGYSKTSIQDLVDYLGIGRGSLYNAFENKHAIFLAALDRYANRRIASHLRALTENSPRKSFRKMFRNYIDDILDDTDNKGCLLMATAELGTSDPEVAKRIEWVHRQMDDCFTDALRAAKQKGELAKNSDPRALALFFHNTMRGLRVTAAKSNVKREELEAVVNTALQLLE